MKQLAGALCLGVVACLALDNIGPEFDASAHFAVQPRWVAAIPGQSLQLTAGITDPEGQIVQVPGVTWRSSDSTIADVDSRGIVRAYSVGSTTVEASLGDSLQALTVVVATPVLVGAGDVASCISKGDEATAAILDTTPGIVFVAGDIAYDSSSTDNFTKCYAPSWGRHRVRTRPAPGNHEYYAAGARPYYNYFGVNAGNPDKGYYSYDVAGWHVIVINSSMAVGRDSPQLHWLLKDLATDTAHCTVAYWHFPLFTSGPNGPYREMREVWRALHSFGADIVINGHDHIYERFAPQDADSNADPLGGIRQFIVGTGGKSLYPLISNSAKNSEIANSSTFGVLKLTLHPSSYEWLFVAAAPGTFRDSGSGQCHR